MKKQTIQNNAYAVILNDEKNDKMKIMTSHVFKKQRVNIMNETRSFNKKIKKSC